VRQNRRQRDVQPAAPEGNLFRLKRAALDFLGFSAVALIAARASASSVLESVRDTPERQQCAVSGVSWSAPFKCVIKVIFYQHSHLRAHSFSSRSPGLDPSTRQVST